MQQSNIQGIDLSPYKTATLNHLHEGSKLKAIQYVFHAIKEAGGAPTVQDAKMIVEDWQKEFERDATAFYLQKVATEANELQEQNNSLRKDIEGLIKERGELKKALEIMFGGYNSSTLLNRGNYDWIKNLLTK